MAEAVRWIPTGTLFLMMLSMGMTLHPADFARVVRDPRAFVFGALGQLLLLPVLALAIAWALSLPDALAIGLVLIAACPGGVMSNALTHYARGDTALSVSLTALSSTIAFATVPLVLGIAFAILPVDAQAGPVVLPVGETAATLFTTTALPIFLGMIWVRMRPLSAARLAGPLLATSTSVLMLLIAGLGFNLAVSEQDIGGLFARAILSVVLLIGVLALAAGIGARSLRLPARQRRTLLLELSLQNFNLAMVIAMGLLGEPRYTGTAIVYLPAMLLFAGVVVFRARATLAVVAS